MLENDVKGWHGSYSAIGRISAERFPMILIKDQILKGRYKKKKMKDYFSTEEDINNNNIKIIIDEGIDIFNNGYKGKTKLKKRKKEICEPNAKKNIPEEYKYHNLHHKDLFNNNKRLKYQSNLSSVIYDPKKDFVWAKTLTGPQWNLLCGRDNDLIFKSDIEAISPKDDKYKKNIINTNKNKLNSYYSLRRGVPMDKMTQRGIIPIYYDLRIRNDRPFIINNNKTVNPTNLNILNNLAKTKSYKLIKKEELSQLNNIISNSEISFNQTTSQTQNHNFSKNKLKKIYSSPEINHSINFSKSLSREQYNYIKRNREGIRPFFNPKYDLVEPRSLTMVSYKKNKDKSSSKRLIGIDTNLFFDPDKVINKINNHKENNVPNFKFMTSKNGEEGNLPSHMNNIFNRASLEIITEKGLKMNNYSESEMKNDYSDFCQKKSFNRLINYDLLKNEKNNILFNGGGGGGVKSNLEKLAKKLGNNKKIKNLMEFYTKNLDNDKIQYTGSKFDSVTFKSIKSNGKLNMKEKELFNLNFSDIES